MSCTKCNITLTLENKVNGTKWRVCKPCFNTYVRNWWKTHPKQYKQHTQNMCNAGRIENGITIQEVKTMRQKQRGKCAICNIKFTKEPHADHNHKTGKLRGLLCRNCNCGIGMFKDNPKLLKRASVYLS